MNKKMVGVDTVVRSYGEQVSTHWQNGCSPNYGPGPVDYTPLTGYEVSVVSVEWWTGASTGDMFSTTCPAPSSPPAPDLQGLQRVTIEAHSTDGRGRVQLQVIVRRGNT